MGIIGDIWTVATGLDARHDRLMAADRSRRDRAAQLFDDIADTLQRVVTDVRAGIVPHGGCQEMRSYAGRFAGAVAPILGQEAHDMAELLDRAYEVERLWVELKDVADADAQLRKLDRAGGMFRAEAALLRATDQ